MSPDPSSFLLDVWQPEGDKVVRDDFSVPSLGRSRRSRACFDHGASVASAMKRGRATREVSGGWRGSESLASTAPVSPVRSTSPVAWMEPDQSLISISSTSPCLFRNTQTVL